MRQLIIILLFFTQSLLAQTDKYLSIGKNDQLYSTIYSGDREFIVHVPKSENKEIKSETYPVLFLLDGENLFIKTVGILNHLSSAYGGEKCPKMIIVGIKHPNRMKDLLPVISKDNPKNDDKFTEFLETELIPYIDKNYPTQPYRLLVGHSLGGLRVANTLVYHPHIFNSYIALDPSLGHDMNVWSYKTDELLKKASFSNKSLYVAMAQTMPVGMDTTTINKDTSGASRHMRAIMRFCNGITRYNVTGLSFNWKYYPDEAHAGVTFLGLYDGLNSSFSWYPNKNFKKIFEKSVTPNEAVNYVLENYQNISQKMGFNVLPQEQYINEITEYLLRKDMIDKATKFAELNLKNYPNSESAKSHLKEILWSKKKPLRDLLATKTVQEIYKLCILESKKLEPEFNILESAINDLGYELLQSNKAKDALLIFQTNIELYPNSSNVWDSYGECLLLIGKQNEGLEAYKKSLELNPDNKNAESILKKHKLK